jgi:hypothetical protein
MISMIYVTYLVTYIAILIKADKSDQVNFLLGHTSSVTSAATKGYILLFLTLFFVIFLIWTILKTVFTDPGFFPEPMDLEYKLISNSIEDLLDQNQIKKPNNEKSHGRSPVDFTEDCDKKYKNLNDKKDKNYKKYLRTKSRNYINLQDEQEYENEDNNKQKNGSSRLNEKEKDYNNSNYSNILIKDSLENKNDQKKDNNELNKSNESYTLIVNFSSTVTEGPLNYIEFNEYHRGIDKFYDSFNQKKNESDHEMYMQTQKNNDEIIDSNKNNLMKKRRNMNLNNKNCNNRENDNTIDVTDIYKGVDISRLNQCGTCQRIKIERSHHCKMCQKCVLKMDHHCPWLANCIGFFNYKYFCLVHFYGTISTGLIFLTYWETLANLHLNYNTNVIECYFVDFVYMMNFALMAFLMWLLWVNTKLVLNGETIIEQSDRERFPSSKSFNVYDMGKKRNFTNIFGNNWWTWFIPAFANLKGNGLLFETKKNFFIEK